jgi:hypothetical protein
MENNSKHWLIRVKDGINFKNSKYNIWGSKRGRHDCIKTIIKKIKPEDILWFFTSKNFGGRCIGMAEYTNFFDRNDEPLVSFHTYGNKELGWNGDEEWDIQLHYKDLYITEKQDIKIVIQCAGTVMEYDTFKKKIKDDLYMHYKNYCFYCEPIYRK